MDKLFDQSEQLIVTQPPNVTGYVSQDISALHGVGEKLAVKLDTLLGGRTVRHLLFCRPVRWVSRKMSSDFNSLQTGDVQTAAGIVQDVAMPSRGSKIQKVRLADTTGFLTLVYFNSSPGFLSRQFPLGEKVTVSGLVEDFHGQRQMTHPDYVVLASQADQIPAVEPVYSLTAGITNRRLHSLIVAAVNGLPETEEWLDPSLLTRHSWPSFRQALQILHKPRIFDEPLIETARERLAYDEALSRAITFRKLRSAVEEAGAPALHCPSGVLEEFATGLPFKLTKAQSRANKEIASDLVRTIPMQRMLQGDVGSGKTTVAAYACLHAVRAGFQVAVMAPTEILARQLYASVSLLLSGQSVSVQCLTGGTKSSQREEILDSAGNGELDILCGTHALFQEKVSFHKLGLVIIDEQHRFGVNDRARLFRKGQSPHMLIMSATPIPRSLAMTIHGDVDLTILDEKPKGRKPVETRTLPEGRLDDVINAVGRAIGRGEQVFWVCPRVDDEEGGVSAVMRHAMLDEIYEKPVGLVHGRMTSQEKADALETFRSGRSSVLVATTVIEVGVDVPSATIMVIEGAEKFGLAQLHQLRGRVGRGDKPSYCLLVYTPPLGEAAKTRLDTLRKSEDGFHIAEVDFRLRGPGDILGVAQSGLPDFFFLDLSKDQGLLAMSQKDAGLRAGRPGESHGRADAILMELFASSSHDRPTA